MDRKKSLIVVVVAIVVLAAVLVVAVSGRDSGKKTADSSSTTQSGEVLGGGDPVGDKNGDESRASIALNDGKVVINGSGATEKDGKITINSSGIYTVSGKMSDGRIVVEAGANAQVTIKMQGVELSCTQKSAIHAMEGETLTIYLEEGTDNRIVSGSKKEDVRNATVEADAKGGALRSECNMVIDGTGALTVEGYRKNGIHSARALTINNGAISVRAVNHGLSGKQGLNLNGGTVEVEAGQDGMQTEGAAVFGKADVTIAAGDDGVHADKQLQVKDGTLKITESDEGLEANQIELAGGDISIVSNDDGINAYGGESNQFGGFGRNDAETDSSDSKPKDTPNLTISGGKVSVNAGGDGLDSNGNLTVSGGEVIVDGPENDGNGALDFASENGGICKVDGGTVLAIGSSGMAETFGDTSKQCSFRCNLEKHYTAGTEISIVDSKGSVLYSHKAAKAFASVVFSSKELKQGESYILQVEDDKTTVEQSAISVELGSGGGFGGKGHGGFGGHLGGDRPNRDRPMQKPQ